MDRPAIEHESPTDESPGAEPPRNPVRAWLAGPPVLGASRRLLVAGAAAALLAAAAAALVGRLIISGTATTPARPATTAARPAVATPPSAQAPVPEGYARFDDAARGLSISLPANWQRLPTPDAQLSVLATGDGASMLMRSAPIGLEIDRKNLAQARKITDGLVRAVRQVKIVEGPKPVQVGGLPGYLYLYTYLDPATGQRGGHAHYFLFRPNQTMITLVFQVLPADRFAGLAPLFDKIGGTLRTNDAASGQSSNPASAAGGTR